MSSRYPRLTAREIVRILKDNEFIEVSQTGSHLKLFNPRTQRTAIVPIHKGKIIPIGTLKSIDKQSGITFN
jgi:predicted RNA binding protein YcfA (HicA-like mRNA interferase family)